MRDNDFHNGSVEGKFTFDVCMVCGDKASGRHYGAITCEGCKGFFKRSIRKHLGYVCRGTRDCEITKHCRNRCQYCRLRKCMSVGMRTDSVQVDRKHLDSKNSKPENAPTPAPLANASLTYGIWGSGFSTSGFHNDVTSNLLPTSSSDLGTLTSVVTTLASMKYWQQDRQGSSSGGESAAAADRNTGEDNSNDGTTEPNVGVPETVLRQDKPEIAKVLEGVTKGVLGSSEPADGVIQEEQLPDDVEGEDLFELEGPLLQDCLVAFHLTTPRSAPADSHLNEHYICESASRLLFLSVQWVRSVPAFQLLTSRVQETLVQCSWSELFTLGLAQCSQALSLPSILTAIMGHLMTSTRHDRSSALHVRQVTDHISKLHDFVKSMLRLQVDDHEYAYLKAMILFSSDHPALLSARQVEKFQEKAYQELRSYITQTFPETNDRFPRLLLRLPVLRSLRSIITEELFFSALIGNVQIESIIPYILRMDSCEHRSTGGSFLSGLSDEDKD